MKIKSELRIKEEELYNELGESEDPIIRAKLDAIGFLLGETDPITESDCSVPQSDEELDHLITILKEEREKVPKYSAFGDPNWKTTDAQINICKWAKD